MRTLRHAPARLVRLGLRCAPGAPTLCPPAVGGRAVPPTWRRRAQEGVIVGARRVRRYWIPVPGMATRHIDDDDLELYALERLVTDERAAPVGRHLLVCEECRERLAGWDGYIGAMREAIPFR